MSDPHRTDVAAPAPDVDGWAEVFRALADPNRLRILLAMHRSPGIRVSDLAAEAGMTDNAASHALNSLRLRGLVTARRIGRERQWSLVDPAVHELLHRIGATHSPLHPDH